MQQVEHQVDLEQFIARVAESGHSALLLDYDGTLAPFSVHRKEAVPYPGVIPVLQEIMASGRSRVVIISGRKAAEVVELLGIQPCPEIWGAHGLEHLSPDGKYELPRLGDDASTALAEAAQWLKVQGTEALAEHKPGSIAVHWRGIPESRVCEVRQQVLRGWVPIAQNTPMSILNFDGGIEMRASDLDKGDAVRRVAGEMRGDAPIAYLGDDATDEAAFDALRNRGLSVLVRREWRETRAQVWLRPPEELLEFLMKWMNAVLPAGNAEIKRSFNT